MDFYAAEAIEEVLAETSFFNSARQVHVGRSHYAHAGLSDGRLTHTDVFAGLQHTQQHRLGVHGQFAYFVKEKRAAVGLFEIAFSVTASIGVSAFHVPEQLRVDGAGRKCAAVHRQTRSVLARRIIVDDTGEDVLADTVLTCDKHAQVRLGDLHSYFYVVHQSR